MTPIATSDAASELIQRKTRFIVGHPPVSRWFSQPALAACRAH
jgi:hypothetical protein